MDHALAADAGRHRTCIPQHTESGAGLDAGLVFFLIS